MWLLKNRSLREETLALGHWAGFPASLREVACESCWLHLGPPHVRGGLGCHLVMRFCWYLEAVECSGLCAFWQRLRNIIKLDSHYVFTVNLARTSQHWCCLTQNAAYRNATKWSQIMCFLSNRIQKTKRNRKYIPQVKFHKDIWYKEFYFKNKMFSQPSLKITGFIFFLWKTEYKWCTKIFL